MLGSLFLGMKHIRNLFTFAQQKRIDMSKFIELHLSDNEGTPVLLNENQIICITDVENEAIIYLSIDNNDKVNQVMHVNETYEKIRNLIMGV